MKATKTQKQKYRLWTYDLWANEYGGYEVNDRYKQGVIEINVKAKVYNEGTDQEFTTFDPTDLQLSRAVGGRGLTWDGESEYTLCAEDKHGDPACELERIEA